MKVNPVKLTVEVVEQRLREFHGNLAAVARSCGTTRRAVQDFCQARPKLLAVLCDCREGILDHAESSLYRAIMEGKPWAVTFALKTRGKVRGYSETIQAETGGLQPASASQTPVGLPQKVDQVLRWIVAGATLQEVRDAFPGDDSDSLILSALRSLEDAAICSPRLAVGWCLEATRECYRQMMQAGNHVGALRAVSQIAQLAYEAEAVCAAEEQTPLVPALLASEVSNVPDAMPAATSTPAHASGTLGSVDAAENQKHDGSLTRGGRAEV